MGALVLAVVEDGELVYAGRVGTGFTRSRRAAHWAKRLERRTGRRPGRRARARDEGCALGRAEARVRVRVHGVDGRRRHAPPALPRPARGQGARSSASRRSTAPTASVAAAPVAPSSSVAAPAASRAGASKLANPDKVLFPRDGITKRQIWDYYTAIAPRDAAAPRGAPAHLQRYPDGIDGEEWYQQNAPAEDAALRAPARRRAAPRATSSASSATRSTRSSGSRTSPRSPSTSGAATCPPGSTGRARHRSRARVPGLRRARSRSGRRAVGAPHRGGARRAHAARRALARERRQDERQARPAHPRPHRARSHARAGDGVRGAGRARRRQGAARRGHGRAHEGQALGQALRRLRPERRGAHHRVAVHDPRARRRRRVDAASRGTR